MIALAAGASACSTSPTTDDTTPTPPESSQTGDDGTLQAMDTLQAFFAAWEAKDQQTAESYLAPDRRRGSWGFDSLDRVEFGAITPSPEQIEGYLTSGHGRVTGASPEDVRCFQADVTFYYKPGSQGPAPDGEAMPWMWFLERVDAGTWTVTDWGA
jgi:hypothetical protein